jgi:hypothetical protein
MLLCTGRRSIRKEFAKDERSISSPPSGEQLPYRMLWRPAVRRLSLGEHAVQPSDLLAGPVARLH